MPINRQGIYGTVQESLALVVEKSLQRSLLKNLTGSIWHKSNLKDAVPIIKSVNLSGAVLIPRRCLPVSQTSKQNKHDRILKLDNVLAAGMLPSKDIMITCETNFSGKMCCCTYHHEEKTTASPYLHHFFDNKHIFVMAEFQKSCPGCGYLRVYLSRSATIKDGRR